ncbi:MAG: ABC transporter permease [Clostridia bacterium]|nr:ABC transporter permease [Clostridia bacterium]MBQ8716558.1 ABC transporter permease [Clostridia bacterium]
MKSLAFADRNKKEILRDPISFIFCLGFPVAMLAIFRVISYHTGGHWMTMEQLIPGVSVFGLSFVMLFMTLLVAKDRGNSFLTRLYHAPLRTVDFVLGYALPGALIGLVQTFITYAAGALIALVPNGQLTAKGIAVASKVLTSTGAIERVTVLPWGGLFAATLAAIPAVLFFVACGILFGTILGERSAPGVSSAIISAAGLLGGCWMSLELMGSFEKFCRFLPFYPAVRISRAAFALNVADGGDFAVSLLTVLLWTALAATLAVVAFRRTMKGDRR